MKFKVLQGTSLYNDLAALDAKMNLCHSAAYDLVTELGYDTWRSSPLALVGGISSIECPGGKPEGWKSSGSGENEFMPSLKSKLTRDLAKRIEDLPVVTRWALNSMVGYNSKFGNPAFQVIPEMVLLAFSENMEKKIVPKPDMIEITVAEFNEWWPKDEKVAAESN